MNKNSRTINQAVAQTYWWAHIVLACGVLVWSAAHWHCQDGLRFSAYLLTAMIAGATKVRLPGVTGTASGSFLFILIGIVDLGPMEAIAMAAISMLAQCTWRTLRRPKPRQVLFSISSGTVAVYVAAAIFSYARAHTPEPVALAAVALSYFAANTFSVAGIIALTESISVWTVAAGNRWLLPYYAGATSIAWMVGTLPRATQWEVPLICLPVVYLVHRSYRTHLGQIEQEKKHMVEMNGVQMRTIEALALAIDAKDHTTHDHLQRVQLYALEIGKELGLSPSEMDALRAASVLHDIGKLAVPEHIICKPGKLTREEFQKMKIHPVVGAEILERVSFPYPVVPIVRSHHEKWDGTGYPDGLAGTDIPIGSRILAAVDCFDALASDRQYRRALPVDEAIAKVVSEGGTSFDPAVVEVLQRRYRELEVRAQGLSVIEKPKLSTDITITRGAAPGAGFAAEAAINSTPGETDSLDLPAMERLNLDEALAIAAVRIKRELFYDAIAIYLKEGETLRAEFVGGTYGGVADRGLVGWVAENGQPIVNGSTCDNAGTNLQSSLAIPIIDASHKNVGVLAVYRREPDAFSAAELALFMKLERPLARMITADRSARDKQAVIVLPRRVSA